MFYWHNHKDVEGKHAVLSASNYHWLGYSVDKLKDVHVNLRQKEYGTKLHEYASIAISLGMRQSTKKSAINKFINDSISYGMESEKVVFYSEYCFGTADAIKFDQENNRLLIFDLKSGKTDVSFNQLDIYAALFCLEYSINPYSIEFIERIYTDYDNVKTGDKKNPRYAVDPNLGYVETSPPSELISDIMDKIRTFEPIVRDIYSIEF